MTPEQVLVDHLSRGYCPDCGTRGFVIGPAALGATAQNINIECANLNCRSRFSAAFFSSQCINANRIPKRTEGGLKWASEPTHQ